MTVLWNFDIQLSTRQLQNRSWGWKEEFKGFISLIERYLGSSEIWFRRKDNEVHSLIKYNKQFLSPSVKLLEIQRWKRHHPLEAVCVINLKAGYSYIYEPVTTQVENPTLYQWENLHFKKEKMGNVLKIWISMFSVKMKIFLKYKNIWKNEK